MSPYITMFFSGGDRDSSQRGGPSFGYIRQYVCPQQLQARQESQAPGSLRRYLHKQYVSIFIILLLKSFNI